MDERQTVYDVLMKWKGCSPQGPDVLVQTPTTDYTATCGYLTNHVWGDDMKKLHVIIANERDHVIIAE